MKSIRIRTPKCLSARQIPISSADKTIRGERTMEKSKFNVTIVTLIFSTVFLLAGCGNVGTNSKGSSASKYGVTYNGNGNTSGSVPSDATAYQKGETVTVLGNTGSLVKTGYSFNGWNTLASGYGTTYTVGENFTMGTANVTLYAQWTASASGYTMTYNGNGGAGSVPVDSNRYYVGQTVTMPGNSGLTYTGYSFVGWQTKADGSGTTYAAGKTFTMGSANVTLYALWAGGYAYAVNHNAWFCRHHLSVYDRPEWRAHTHVHAHGPDRRERYPKHRGRPPGQVHLRIEPNK